MKYNNKFVYSNSKNKNNKKKILNLNEYKREKTDYYDNTDEDKMIIF